VKKELRHKPPRKVHFRVHTSWIEVIDKRDEVVEHCIRKIQLGI
jgi:hypothetical protein